MHKKRTDIEPTLKEVETFWERVDKSDGCWEWTGPKDRAGYGVSRVDGRDVRSSRLSWRIHRGAIPDGKFVGHRCGNLACVRPDHLFVWTHKDVAADLRRQGRARARFTPEQLDSFTRTVRAMLARGMSQAQIGACFGLTADRVRRYLTTQKERRAVRVRLTDSPIAP